MLWVKGSGSRFFEHSGATLGLKVRRNCRENFFQQKVSMNASDAALQSPTPSVPTQAAKKTVKPLLFVGIVLMPYIFGWLTLRKGYSVKARALSLTWIFGYLVGLNPSVHDEVFNRTHTPAEQAARIASKAKDSAELQRVRSAMDAKEASSKQNVAMSSRVVAAAAPVQAKRFSDMTPEEKMERWAAKIEQGGSTPCQGMANQLRSLVGVVTPGSPQVGYIMGKAKEYGCI